MHLPHAGPNGTPVTKAHTRMDLVLTQDKGRSFSLGVGKRGLTFGGTL
jgi:hypothetical protein